VKEVAKEKNVPLIDMFEKSKKIVEALGDEKSKSLFLNGVKKEFRNWDRKRDNTHFYTAGCCLMASLAVEGIKRIALVAGK